MFLIAIILNQLVDFYCVQNGKLLNGEKNNNHQQCNLITFNYIIGGYCSLYTSYGYIVLVLTFQEFVINILLNQGKSSLKLWGPKIYFCHVFIKCLACQGQS